MRLLIDLGNTRLKWAWCDHELWQTGAADVTGSNFDQILDELAGSREIPEDIILASVAEEEATAVLKTALRARWPAPIIWVQSLQQQLGVVNHYRNPAQLGADRWAALIAARQEVAQSVCVISCGTAVTVDALNAAGEFVGGVILPGLVLMRRSLADGTAAIAVSDGNDTSCQARSTEDAVMSGTRFGLAGAVDRIVAEHRRILGDDMVCLITGGSAESILPLLGFSATHKPDLVLLGLKAIAEAGA